MYCVIGAPPFYEGSVHETVACALPPVANTVVGIPGWVTEIIGVDESETAPTRKASRVAENISGSLWVE